MPRGVFVIATACTLAVSCAESQEAARVSVPVVVAPATGQGVPNELGWLVTLTSFRCALDMVLFTTQGELHAGLLERVGAWVLPRAYAHPGHLAGGEALGELEGPLVVDWVAEAGRVLGQATMIVGRYDGVVLALAQATGLSASDPLFGHTAVLTGSATRGGQTITFSAVLDAPAGSKVIGAPFAMDVANQETRTVRLGAALFEPTTMTSLFRKLDFAALDPDGNGDVAIEPGGDAHNVLRRHLQEHIHYAAAPEMP